MLKAKYIKVLFPAFALAAGLSSCEDDCVCQELMPGEVRAANVRFPLDWALFPQEVPTGATVICAPDDEGVLERRGSNDISGVSLRLLKGTYRALAINQSEDEFGYITFTGTETIGESQAHGEDMPVPMWATIAERAIWQPDWLACAVIDNFVIDDRMLVEYGGNMCPCADHPLEECCCPDPDKCTCQGAGSCSFQAMQPQSVVSTLNVKVEIDDIKFLKGARACLSGLADGYALEAGYPLNGSAAQILTDWEIQYYDESKKHGCITAEYRTFGLPCDGISYIKENNFLLQLLLIDGATICSSQLDVSDDLVYDPVKKTMSLCLKLAKPLPDVYVGGGGGFDATVDDWSDAEELNVKG